jgi:hypothetical protein
MNGKYYGKYRGMVTDINDPLMLGRIQAKVPDILGDQDSGWAMPCVPCDLSNEIGSALPKVGAGVWIEFEKGDPDYPIWSGCWYDSSSAEIPPSLRNSE